MIPALPLVLLAAAALAAGAYLLLRRRDGRPRVSALLAAALPVVALSAAALYAAGPLLPNGWSLLVSRGFFIPRESSVYRFRTLVEHEGSGEWWVYGEDDRYFYYAGDGVAPHDYVTIKKSDAARCPGFRPTDFGTWCAKNRPAE